MNKLYYIIIILTLSGCVVERIEKKVEPEVKPDPIELVPADTTNEPDQWGYHVYKKTFYNSGEIEKNFIDKYEICIERGHIKNKVIDTTWTSGYDKVIDLPNKTLKTIFNPMVNRWECERCRLTLKTVMKPDTIIIWGR